MMENDDKLLTSFFADHRQEIADNGFSRRVLRHLPDRSRHLAQIWTVFCFTLTVRLPRRRAADTGHLARNLRYCHPERSFGA